ncbi:tetratricopeptide repeat protein [Algoriphagus sp. AGSA1]|uniref:tetratricopeptide repeat-containing sensor histidine kinase n=1 Tax=Algoriphagus sp. AGSA1 TaxID=2907213 RepID=UPI001F491870|nr:tetratricopeptide repeat-containing sensor histidine kinase [Algoriphagus sp. AGSA1]MCE7053095.1 tetratricopeptide repeat protein [Algoriphagus sp. AGSA1]
MIPHFLVWILPLVVPVQHSQTDSLKMIVAQTDNDSIKATSLLSLSKLYYTFDQDTAILYGKEASLLAKKNGFRKIEANSLNILGVSYLIKAEYENALSTHLEALDIRESIRDTVGLIETTMNLGNIYYRLQELEKAVLQYEKSLALAQLIKHERAMSLLYNNLGSYFLDRWLSYKEKEDFASAKQYLENSKAIKEKLNDTRSLTNTLLQLGELHYESGEKSKGIQFLTEALEIAEETNNIEGKLSSLSTLSDYHRDNNSLAQALEYATEAYELALETKSNYRISIAASKMAHLSALNKDFEKAYEYQRINESSTDSIFNDSRQKIRAELEIQYESEKKELENQKLIKEQELAALALTRKNELLIISVVVAALLVALVWYQRKTNLKLHAAHKELKAINDKVQSQYQQIHEQSEELNSTNLKLKAANDFRDKLFSIISHDLRTPFSSLNASLDLWHSGDLSKNELDYILSTIAIDAQSASSLLSNLLTWARTQMSSDEVKFSEVNLSELIAENQHLLIRQLEQKHLILENNIPTGFIIITDRDRLNFIIRNILSNSIKFTSSGGQISVTLDPDDSKAILIEDSGVGMNSTQIASLFNKKQYSTTGTHGEQGTGIGLMLCKDFADSIGATITVSSEEGNSTSFKIAFA